MYSLIAEFLFELLYILLKRGYDTLSLVFEFLIKFCLGLFIDKAFYLRCIYLYFISAVGIFIFSESYDLHYASHKRNVAHRVGE